MKWLFVVMILVNLGFAAWAANRPVVEESRSRQDVTSPEYVNRLLLLSELDGRTLRERNSRDVLHHVAQGDDSNGHDDSSEFPVFTRMAICFSVAPLTNPEEADRVDAWFTSRGGTPTLREGERREISRFWVYLPPFENREAAATSLRQMLEQDIDDIYIIHRGDMANVVSLGLYRHRGSLERRLIELRSKGYDPFVEQRYETKRSSWFDVSFPVGITFSREHFLSAFPRVEATEERCT